MRPNQPLTAFDLECFGFVEDKVGQDGDYVHPDFRIRVGANSKTPEEFLKLFLTIGTERGRAQRDKPRAERPERPEDKW